MDKAIYEQIIKKKEFSQLPREDVRRAFAVFEKRQVSEEEKIRLTRDLLRKVFSVFTSKKLLKMRDYDSDWILKKHFSTKERLDFYEQLYQRILSGVEGKTNVFDLGAGVNGFSYKYFQKKVNYLGIEAMGQLVDLMNRFFDKNNFSARAKHLSLFDLEKVKDLLEKIKGSKIIFLFKTLDSLEMLERDYSKKLLLELTSLVDRVVVSFATRSLIKKTKFKAKRTWLINFITEHFQILDDFELGNERYIVFRSK